LIAAVGLLYRTVRRLFGAVARPRRRRGARRLADHGRRGAAALLRDALQWWEAA
jgi:hypothetical protein